MDGFSEKKWFVYMGDHHEGPFSLAEIQAKLAIGSVTRNNYVWCEGMADWRPMPEVQAFESLMSPVSAAPVEAPAPSFTQEIPTAAKLEPAALEIAMQATPQSAPAPALELGPSLKSEPAQTVQPTQEARSGVMSRPVTETQTSLKKPVFDNIAVSMQAVEGAQESLSTTKANQEAAERLIAQHASKGTPVWKKKGVVLTLVAVLLVVALGAAINSGALSGVLQSPALKATTAAFSDMLTPTKIKLIEKIPALSGFISPIPTLQDLGSEEQGEMHLAASSRLATEGPKLALAVSRDNLMTPTFYVASNLPDGTQIDVYVVGMPETLLNQLSFNAKLPVTIKNRLGRSDALKFPDGKPIPKGQYYLYATEGSQQIVPEAQSLLANVAPMPSLPNTIPANLYPPTMPRPLRLLVIKNQFLGGEKDASYQQRLGEFHTRLREKATTELAEVKQFAGTIESQLSKTVAKFNSLRKSKPAAALKAWQPFEADWLKLSTQLNETFNKWSPDALKNDYFYGVLYQLVLEAHRAVTLVHEAQQRFFKQPADAKLAEAQLNEFNAGALRAITAMKEKISNTEKLQPAASGMPQREGL